MMTTIKGATMSPRMERLWQYIMHERGINLCDWSTDECVEREQTKLRTGEAELVKRLAANPSRELENLLTDYRSIMNRRPHGRVDARSLAAGEKAALAARAEIDDEIVRKVRGRGW